MVVDEIEVRRVAHGLKRDIEIANAIAHLLTTAPGVPVTVQATVENGFVSLTGEVEWECQKDIAAAAVRCLPNVASVENKVNAV